MEDEPLWSVRKGARARRAMQHADLCEGPRLRRWQVQAPGEARRSMFMVVRVRRRSREPSQSLSKRSETGRSLRASRQDRAARLRAGSLLSAADQGAEWCALSVAARS